jgi:hypothetical protein
MFKAIIALLSFFKFLNCLTISFTCRDEVQSFINRTEIYTCTAAGPQYLSVLTSNSNVSEVMRIDGATVSKVMEDSEVKFVKIYNHTILDFPNGLGTYFTGVEGLQMTLCGLKTLRKESLRDFVELKYLNVRRNSLEVLRHNLFEDNKA